jgi:long-chain acyl-CoA synthetase
VDVPHPWTSLYPVDVVPQRSEHDSLVAAWAARVAREPGARAVAYFDGTLTVREVDDQSDALAVGLAGLGVRPGDRVGIHLQNVPAYPLLLLALWKLGATALILNPMYRGEELRLLVEDAGAVGVVGTDTDVPVVQAAVEGTGVRWVVSSSGRDHQTRDDPRVLPEPGDLVAAPDGDVAGLLARHAGQRPAPVEVAGDDVALLTYTSGTTGPPKGAMNTHANVLAVVATYGDWVGLGRGDAVFAIAPLFHITGAVINATIALVRDSVLVLANRFHPAVTAEAFVEHGVTFTIGSITAFNAIAQLPDVGREHFATVRALYSGGAPIPPSTVERFRERFGVYIHNVYGMTETSSAVVAVPLGGEAPLHEASGTLSVGLPLPWLDARVVDPSGEPVPPGEQGELELAGPQVVPGYWQNPEATERTMPGGRLRTGDGAIMDEHGWVYLVDRLKDQINTSGFKVWPREVEDVLYTHPAVHEVAVVGHPDDYRGEQVVAYVSLEPGASVTTEELVAHTRERLAAYKVPRAVHVLEDLPKTQTGKIRRAALRER